MVTYVHDTLKVMSNFHIVPWPSWTDCFLGLLFLLVSETLIQPVLLDSRSSSHPDSPQHQ